MVAPGGCIFSSSYIKPQLSALATAWSCSCIFSSSYIKPQPWRHSGAPSGVVSSQVPTSNHNDELDVLLEFQVVSSQVPTSNHNLRDDWNGSTGLYLLKFLHQTTTFKTKAGMLDSLYLLKFLHQTTTLMALCPCVIGCIFSSSYIKPQR